MISRRGLLALALTACAAERPAPTRARPTPAPVAPPVSRLPPPVPEEPRRRALREAIDDAAAYLARACRADGSFVYRINLDPEVPVPDAYNVLRHAGAIYAMASYQARWPSPTIAAALGRALDRLGSFVAPVPDRPAMSALWSHDDRREAKLGGAGLGLVALESVPAAGDLETRRRLARFIAFMQKSDGSFHAKFFAGEGADDSWVSLYYPGEAALGMVMLHERDPDGGWGDVARRALSFLATSRRGQLRVPPDHWALIASERALSRSAALFSPGERESIVAHSRQVVASMLASRPELPASAPAHGSFTPDGRTTPTATRLEGLLAARGHVDQPELVREIDAAIEAGID